MKNNSEVHGKVIRVMWSHRDPDARRSGIGNVFVKVCSVALTVSRRCYLFSDVRTYGKTILVICCRT